MTILKIDLSASVNSWIEDTLMEFSATVGLLGIASLVQDAYLKGSTAKVKKQRGEKLDIQNILNKLEKDENGHAKPCNDLLVAFILYWKGKKNAGSSVQLAATQQDLRNKAPDGILKMPRLYGHLFNLKVCGHIFQMYPNQTGMQISRGIYRRWRMLRSSFSLAKILTE